MPRDIIADEPPVLSPGSPLGSARELVQRRFIYSAGQTLWHQQSTFYVWTSTHYRDTSREEIRAAIYDFLDGAKRKNDDKLVPFNPTRSKVADVLEALAAAAQLPGMVRAPAWLDAAKHPDPRELLACSNGLLHLPTRTLLPHTPTFFSVNAVDYPYDRTAGEPTEWFKFLGDLWLDDWESIAALQELFGLLLTPDTGHQKAFLIIGPKRSGKGTIARVLTGLVGKENVVGPTLSSLSQNFGLWPLIGKPLAVISDARLGGRTDVHIIAERILSITGEDSLTIDRKNLSAWTGQLSTRFLILTNELPRLSDSSGALASRFIIWRLAQSFFGKEDLTLTQRLLAERPAILSWAIDGYDRLMKRGFFVQPTAALQAVEELADLASPIGAFLRERCVVDPIYSEECGRMFEAWIAWCKENGRDHPGTTQIFSRDLRAALPSMETEQHRNPDTGERERFYRGVALTKQHAW